MRKLYVRRQGSNSFNPRSRKRGLRPPWGWTKCVNVGAARIIWSIWALWVDYVAKLQAQPAQRRDLIGIKQPANSHFQVGAHARLRGLGGGDFVDTLLDHVLVDRIRVQRTIQSLVCLTQAKICRLALFPHVLDDPANLLTLFGSQVKLLDRVCGRRGWILGDCRYR